jgi:hypothetical protein
MKFYSRSIDNILRLIKQATQITELTLRRYGLTEVYVPIIGFPAGAMVLSTIGSTKTIGLTKSTTGRGGAQVP